MLKTLMDRYEAHLLSISKVPGIAGHPIHKGTPREIFIREFLEWHTSERTAIGTGEIIDCDSSPCPPQEEGRPQNDIVIYNREYPKLYLGGGINAFLSESVVATIEVKSKLTKAALKRSIKSAKAVKNLKRNVDEVFKTDYTPPGILSYVVAYDGPKKMETVYKWITDIHEDEGILFPDIGKRMEVSISSIDAVFVLGRGFVQFDNSPIAYISEETRRESPNKKWIVGKSDTGNLLLLFVFLTCAISGAFSSILNPFPYLREHDTLKVEFLE